MAIRPVDLQATIFQSTIIASSQRTAETAPQTAQTVAAQQFADKLQERQETVQETQQAEGNRVEERREAGQEQPDRRPFQRRKKQPGEPLDELENSVLGGGIDGEHTIDFSA